MIERFKPAGHKAQELSAIVMPDEAFKPIQRVIDTTLGQYDKTIGYLYQGIEYTPGVVGDVVLSRGFLCGTNGEIRTNITEWREYERNDTENPIKWFIPPAPIILELCYRTQHEDTVVSREAQQSWHKTLNPKTWWLRTSTITTYNNGQARVRHNWSISAGSIPVPEDNNIDLSDDNTPVVNNFLRAILGKRSYSMQHVFGQYCSSMQLWTPSNNYTAKRVLVLGVSSGGRFVIDANDYISNLRPARGVAVAKKLLTDKRYEVRDD
ncbi:TPA: hypothetical protein HA251_02365 [Candidatus Woesearchaeota archaeon]|nr:hypothetical protein [Candidatus Woesearchaeota archaeon]